MCESHRINLTVDLAMIYEHNNINQMTDQKFLILIFTQAL